MGNSHAQVGIIPEVVDHILGTKSISLITPGASILKTEHEVYEVLRILDPDLVLIETAPIFGGRSQSEWPESFFAMYDLMPLSLTKLRYVLKDFSYLNSVRYYFPIYDKHTSWKTPERIFKDILLAFQNRENPYSLKNQGYLQLTEIISPLERASEVDELNVEECVSGEVGARLQSLARIIEFGERNRTQIALFEMPVLKRRYETCKQFYQEEIPVSEETYHPVLSNKVMSLLWFRDVYHTSNFGALQATLDMVHWLESAHGFSINQEIFDKYAILALR